MTKLLVSVRSAAEAELALQGGAQLIDIKEPARGPLGAADPETIAAIVEVVAGRVPLSAALGELLDGSPIRALLPRDLAYAKLGLASCGRKHDWQSAWREAIGRFPGHVVPVAVAYVDPGSAVAPPPAVVLEAALTSGFGAILFDTYDKSNGTLFDHLSLVQLRPLVTAAKEHRLVCVLAGSLQLEHIDAAVSLAPDYIAIRGAACGCGRNGRLEAARVERIAAAVRRACAGKSRLAARS